MVQVGHQISSLYNPDHTNFGPRMGFAWISAGRADRAARRRGLIYETVNWQSFVAFKQCLRPAAFRTESRSTPREIHPGHNYNQ